MQQVKGAVLKGQNAGTAEGNRAPACHPERSEGAGAPPLPPYGASLSMLHLSPARTYRIRSCSRFSLPCQNSIVSGFTR